MFVARPPLGHTLATSQSAETSRRQSYLTCVYITKRLESACSQLAQSCSKGILEASSFREMSSKARSRGVDYLRVWECVMVIMKQVARAGIQDTLAVYQQLACTSDLSFCSFWFGTVRSPTSRCGNFLSVDLLSFAVLSVKPGQCWTTAKHLYLRLDFESPIWEVTPVDER